MQPLPFVSLCTISFTPINDVFLSVFKIPLELRGGFIAAVDEGKIKTMANRSMPAAPQPTPGAILLGDSFNMRHPLTGGGMTVALSDVVIVRDLLRPLATLNDTIALCEYMNSFYKLRKVMHICIYH